MLELELGVGLHEVHRAFARLEATDEEDVDRAVVRDGDRLADLDHVLCRRVVAPGRSDDPDTVAEPPELFVALADVRVRTAWARVRVRRDDPDLHRGKSDPAVSIIPPSPTFPSMPLSPAYRSIAASRCSPIRMERLYPVGSLCASGPIAAITKVSPSRR